MSARVALLFALAGLVRAQAPSDLKTRLTDLKQIDVKPGLTRIVNAEGDGRDAQVFSAWRDNGNAWGFNVYLITMPRRLQGGAGTEWWIVGIARDSNAGLAYELTDNPHTGEDAITSVRFARGKLDGKAATLLITAERHWTNAVPDPVPAVIRIFVLKNKEDQAVGTTADAFVPVIDFTTKAAFSDANEALHAELGLPSGQ